MVYLEQDIKYHVKESGYNLGMRNLFYIKG